MYKESQQGPISFQITTPHKGRQRPGTFKGIKVMELTLYSLLKKKKFLKSSMFKKFALRVTKE